jgi:hypothetical protein
MDAPIYPPQLVFEQPIGVAAPLRLETYSIEELMGMPAAWAIVLRRVPAVKFIVGAQQAKPHLGNMTLRSLALHLPNLTPQLCADINAELASLPPTGEGARP